MSIMGRLAAGLGAGVAILGQKYIDEEVAQQRAQFLADLQRTTASKIRDDEFAFQTDPTKAEARRAVKAGDIVAEGEAKTKADLARAQNTDLAAAEAARGSILKKAEAQATIDVQKAAGNDPAYIKALRAISSANAAPDRTDYKGRELDNAIKQMTVDNAKRAQELRTEFGKAPPERQQQIKDELSILTGKDADKFVPVPLKDAEGNITGYKVFDAKSGKFMDDGAAQADPIKAAMDAARKAREPQGKAAAAPQGAPARAPAAPPDYRPASDGSGRMVDVATGRTLTAEQSAVLAKMQRGEPTTPRERALLKG